MLYHGLKRINNGYRNFLRTFNRIQRKVKYNKNLRNVPKSCPIYKDLYLYQYEKLLLCIRPMSISENIFPHIVNNLNDDLPEIYFIKSSNNKITPFNNFIFLNICDSSQFSIIYENPYIYEILGTISSESSLIESRYMTNSLSISKVSETSNDKNDSVESLKIDKSIVLWFPCINHENKNEISYDKVVKKFLESSNKMLSNHFFSETPDADDICSSLIRRLEKEAAKLRYSDPALLTSPRTSAALADFMAKAYHDQDGRGAAKRISRSFSKSEFSDSKEIYHVPHEETTALCCNCILALSSNTYVYNIHMNDNI